MLISIIPACEKHVCLNYKYSGLEGERRKGNRDNGEPSKMIYMQENGIKKSTTLLEKKAKKNQIILIIRHRLFILEAICIMYKSLSWKGLPHFHPPT